MTNKELTAQVKELKAHIYVLETQNKALIETATAMQWLSRRYADKRSTYAVSIHNDATRVLVELGVTLRPDTSEDGETIWARDGMGYEFDGLNDSYFEKGNPIARGEVIPLKERCRLSDEITSLLGTDVASAVSTLQHLADLGLLRVNADGKRADIKQ